MFDAVVAADLDWGIGKTSGLPWPRLKGDLQHFKRVTTAVPSAVVMGRKTWESSEVNGKPLPNRLNVVVTRRTDLVVPAGVLVALSLEAAVAAARAPAALATFVVGGAEIYRAAFAHRGLRYIYLTRVEGRFGCDAFIPDLDLEFERDAWPGEQELEDGGVHYKLERLRRRPET